MKAFGLEVMRHSFKAQVAKHGLAYSIDLPLTVRDGEQNVSRSADRIVLLGALMYQTCSANVSQSDTAQGMRAGEPTAIRGFVTQRTKMAPLLRAGMRF